MNSRAHLVEELRPDKTGKMVKRWVKPVENGSTSSAIPAMQLQADQVADRKALCGELWDTLCMTNSGSNGDTLSDNITLLRTNTIQMLLAYCGDDDEKCENASRWIGYYAGDNALIRELATYADAFDPGTDEDFLEMVISTLNEYDELPETEDYSQVDPDTKDFITELLSITDTLYSDDFDIYPDNTPRQIKDAPLRELLFKHPDRAADIHQVIIDRGTTDIDTIKQVIMNPSKALSEGAL